MRGLLYGLLRNLKVAGVRLSGALLLGLATCAKAADCPPTAPAPTPQQLQQVAQTAKDHGMLWRISKGGVTSYLYASMHVGKLQWAAPGPQTREALRAVKAIALELDPSAPEVGQAMIQGSTARAYTPDTKTQARLNRQADLACLPREALSTLHPILQVMTYSLLQARWHDLDAAYGQEMVLIGVAKASGLPVISLESAQLQLDALIPQDPAKAEELLQSSLQQLEEDTSQQLLERLVSDWVRGDLDDLQHYADWCNCMQTETDRAYMRTLIDERNPFLAQRIDEVHRRTGSVFAAVGALHMTGPRALPDLLRQRGYSVNRVKFQF